VENQFARNRDPIAKKLAILIACSGSIDESNQRRRNSLRTTSEAAEQLHLLQREIRVLG
jgi:hypothetical protein